MIYLGLNISYKINMKTICIGEPKIIMENPYSKHNYFAWPTVAKLQNGKIAVVASGFRLKHICPFGKTVISYSEDNGETYTYPAPVIDTVLDDRDGGLLPFGKSSVIVTSFNNAIVFQRKYATPYGSSYLDVLTEEEEEAALGATFRISNDYGVTFSEFFKSPITSPHGPLELPDGSLLWVGRTFAPLNGQMNGEDCIQAQRINVDGTMEFVGKIENIYFDDLKALSCEPHAIVLDDGTILAHIRVQLYEKGIFTIFQSESSDNGKTWTKPKQILANSGGAPPHLFKHSSGMLICTYSYRGEYSEKSRGRFGIRAMFSRDNGKTWDADYILYENNVSDDLGYPSTIELEDGTLITVFYATPGNNDPAIIMQQKWRFNDEI